MMHYDKIHAFIKEEWVCSNDDCTMMMMMMTLTLWQWHGTGIKQYRHRECRTPWFDDNQNSHVYNIHIWLIKMLWKNHATNWNNLVLELELKMWRSWQRWNMMDRIPGLTFNVENCNCQNNKRCCEIHKG